MFQILIQNFLSQHSMLYFFHHYELPVILQQAQLQQLLLRTHHGMGGMVGLAGIAALASGAAYHDAPGTGTQATPPTTQSTTQTAHTFTAQSTTQTTPSVSTVQTNTTHTGDVIPRPPPPETTATGTNTIVENEPSSEIVTNTDKSNRDSSTDDSDIVIEEISRETYDADIKVLCNGSNSTPDLNEQNHLPIIEDNVTSGQVETSTLDRRRKEPVELTDHDPPLVSTLDDAVTSSPTAATDADE